MASVNLATVENTKLNAICKNMFPSHLVAHKEEVAALVTMIAEHIIPNATVPIIMNGAPRKRNVSVQLLSNILVPARGIREEMEILATTNIQNVNVRAGLLGMLRKGHVFVPVLISAR